MLAPMGTPSPKPGHPTHPNYVTLNSYDAMALASHMSTAAGGMHGYDHHHQGLPRPPEQVMRLSDIGGMYYYNDGLMQDCSNSSASAMEGYRSLALSHRYETMIRLQDISMA